MLLYVKSQMKKRMKRKSKKYLAKWNGVYSLHCLTFTATHYFLCKESKERVTLGPTAAPSILLLL